MATIAENLQAVRSRIARAAQAAGRRADEIQLLAVSKTFPAACIIEAYVAGQRAFGESFAQEAVEKITELAATPLDHRVLQARREAARAQDEAPLAGPGTSPGTSSLPALEWHFIGPIQSNKTRIIAEHFQWVHSIDREKIALRLNSARGPELPPLEVCIEVNVSGERSKSGVAPGGEVPLAEAISRLPQLRLRGLMTIPEPTSDINVQRRRFALLRELQLKLAARGYALDTLSMGMSDDFEAAISEGATIVRVGTAIFGPRDGNR